MTAAAVSGTPGTRLRADALRNRERIVDAAREAFVLYGPEVPLDEIARDAGVGNATLYRHFPDRESLIHHVVLSVMDRVSERAEAAFTEVPEAFDALRRFVFDAADERVGALCPMLTHHIDGDAPEIVAARKRLENATWALMDWGRRSGELRSDVDFGDLMVALSQLARPLPGTGCPEIERFVHRHLQIFLDGLRTPRRSRLTGSAATLEDLRSNPVPMQRA
ncbi:TetR/AcrR family transcriptional regulator [Streptomyces armeniacus]|uniref:TetR/AcrR family transcriptional regulator n=1 Tax=Streptomyces armeniacus TaxID=83291 RepID=A0A345XU97_9ACTN|nr:TetR/AcrR family transcriptional regulator [Streptomyces armeniacus]AXK35213.1 TetR/AcrR family transcriptional regulator [Streptomyces armeniacus]